MSDLVKLLAEAGVPSAKGTESWCWAFDMAMAATGHPDEATRQATRSAIAADRDAVLRCLLEARLREMSHHEADDIGGWLREYADARYWAEAAESPEQQSVAEADAARELGHVLSLLAPEVPR